MHAGQRMNSSTDLDIAVIGGGAAGYFAALRAADQFSDARICIFEAGKRPLEKVRISGGGRCNVTHHCFDPSRLIAGYPRGAKELRGAFHRFQPENTVAWFEERGVSLKAEDDGRMFPSTDSSETIIDCLEAERRRLGIALRTQSRIHDLKPKDSGTFELLVQTSAGAKELFTSKLVMLATGSNRSGYAMAEACGHSITPLAPSLFTFTIEDPALTSLAGISVDDAVVKLIINGKPVSSQRGPLLVTHWGFSGPAVLKLSAFAARELHSSNYKGTLLVNVVGALNIEEVKARLSEIKQSAPRKLLLNTPLFEIPSRLWEYILWRAIPREAERTWAEAGKAALHTLAAALTASEFSIAGKGQFKEEFVTCGGVATDEVDFRSMESKRCPGLFLGGEILDVDGITGGYNFQSAWTTGWLAGSAMAENLNNRDDSTSLP